MNTLVVANKLYNLYSIMSYYPKLNNTNWINLITFIPSIFDEEKINKINQFYIIHLKKLIIEVLIIVLKNGLINPVKS